MERSIEWRMCSIWHKFHSFMLSSPKFKLVAQISPWIAWNCRWFLVKTREWNMLFHRKFSNGKTRLPFKNSSYSRELSSGTLRKRVFHEHPNWNFQNFLVNGKRLILHTLVPSVFVSLYIKRKSIPILRMLRILIFVHTVAKSNDARRVREPWKSVCIAFGPVRYYADYTKASQNYRASIYCSH